MAEVNPLKVFQSKFSLLESKIREYPIIAGDSEDDSKGKPVLFGFYGDFKNKWFYTKHAEEALSFIYDIEEPTIFVFHNLEYDVANLFKESNYLVVDRMVYASGLLKVTLAGTEHFFLNTHSWFKGSLAKMGEFVGIEKLEGDPFSPDYLKVDCKIPYTFTKMFQTKLIKEVGVNLGVTIGKMSMDTYRRSHMISKVQQTYNSPNCLKAFYGGRVEIFKKGIAKEVNVVDINSSYPHVMRAFEYPDTGTIEPSSIKTHEFGIGRFDVYVPEETFLPVLPFKSGEGRLFFPTGYFSGWWTYAEMRYAMEHGARIIKEYEGEGTNAGCMPFASFIDTFYELKEDAGKRVSRNPDNIQAVFDKLFYKYWLNNLFGKWCQHKAGSEMTRDKWPFWKLEQWRKNPEFKESKIGPFYNYKVPKTKPPITANFMWGIYVTTYARINLHRGLMAAHSAGHTLLYCDTDSVMYESRNNVVPFKITSNLGDWDIEKYDLGVFRQAKGYLLCNKAKNVYTIRKSFTDRTGRGHYYGQLESKKKPTYDIKKVACKGVPTAYAYEFIIEGMAKFVKPMRMKEALIRLNAEVNQDKDDAFIKEIGENIWGDVDKYMKSIYIKRTGDKITYPVTAQQIPELEKNAKMQPTSIKKDLEDEKIHIKKPTHKNAFENTIIPAGYFDGKRIIPRKPRLFISQKVHHFRKEQCLELEKGDSWFKGDILQIRTKSNGQQYYHIFVTHYKNKELNAHFWGGLPIKFFDQYGVSENLLNKSVDIKMFNKYFVKEPFEISITISESENKGQVDIEKIELEGELTEQQLKTLLAFKEKIKCQKNPLNK